VPNLLFARPNGELLDLPSVKMAGRTGDSFVEPGEEQIIPLPEGATLTAIPLRTPIGIDRGTGEFKSYRFNPYLKRDEEIWAVGALLPQGFTRTLVPAFRPNPKSKPLPLFGYTAVGSRNGRFIVAARQTDDHHLWNPKHYHGDNLKGLVEEKIRQNPQNRLTRQLGMCALEYGCFTAQNIFYGRWEGGIPVSPQCNARCLGCISSQPAECCPAPQRRLEFVPTVEEVVELAAAHLSKGEHHIISFGQGCEGEPLLQGSLIAQAVKKIRELTSRGTVNINTNAGDPEKVLKLAAAGLDAMRVSMVSASPEIYHAYHRPQNFCFSDVIRSLGCAAASGVFTSLNLLVFPGVADDESEIEKLIQLVKSTGVKKIQLRNLNIDPDSFINTIPKKLFHPLGIPAMLRILQEEIPGLKIGSYSRPVEKGRELSVSTHIKTLPNESGSLK